MGIALLLAAFGSTAAAQDWSNESTPTGENLYGVEQTTNGTFAVGTGGDVLKRTSSGWIEITDTGPSGNSNSLYGIGVTDDREVVWYVGESGAVGRYDVISGNAEDYTNPGELSTNNFNEVAVRGNSGNASVYIAGDDGNVYYTYNGGTDWNVVTPASGSAINSIDFFANRSGHLVDANKKVYETTDGATSWTDIGISGAGESMTDVDSDSTSEVRVSTANGSVYSYDGNAWTKTDVSTNGLRGIETDGGDGYVVGGNGSVYNVSSGTFTQESTDTTNLLRDVDLGSPDVAVGDSGTVVVRSGGGGGDGSDGGNAAPTASFDYTPSSPNASETVTFDASTSADSDGSIASYEWDFDGDGNVEESGASQTATYVFSNPGDYTASLTVTDDNGATDTASQTVTVSEISVSPGNPFFGSNGNPLSRSEAADVLFEWNTNNGVVNGQSIPRSDMADFLFNWNLQRT